MTGVRRPVASAPRLRRLGIDRRSLALLVVYALVGVAIVGRLVQVQVVDAEVYAQAGEDNRSRLVTLPATRGRLYDRQGEVLATSVEAATVYADPKAFVAPDDLPPDAEIPDPAVTAAALADVLDRPAAEIEELLRTPDSRFVRLVRQADRGVGEQVLALGLHGIGVLPEPRRVYPGAGLAGRILGTTDVDSEGVAGLELQHDAILRGEPGWFSFERVNEAGFAIPAGDNQVQLPAPGTDLVLTIDRQVQHTAERVAAEAVAAHDARGASVVVLEVGTGDVVAMATTPSVDLDDRRTLTPDALRNRVVTDVFEPGSVQKTITVATALDEGVVTPETSLQVPETIRVADATFRDSHWRPAERMSVTDVLARSSNVGTIMIAEQLGEERLAAALQDFGFGTRLGTDFPGEAPGLLAPVEAWSGTSLPTIAIGQGIAATLLQEASAYATIANDGVAVTPRILRGTVGPDGRLDAAPVQQRDRVISPSAAARTRELLAAVVEDPQGTGGLAAVDGHRVGGKTGTAQKPSASGYDGYVATFVGMAPVDDPGYVVAVMVDEPTPIWGGTVAAPVFSQVMAEALRRGQVAPTEQPRAPLVAAEPSDADTTAPPEEQ